MKNNYRKTLLLLLLLPLALAETKKETKQTRIAIIGGGISGSFVTKYLTDYDGDCSLDITVFDPPSDGTNQGSRVSSATLENGMVVERGASILFGGNQLVNEMVEGSALAGEPLIKTKPHGGSSDQSPSLGIFDGSGFPLWISSNATTAAANILAWRYNIDLYRIQTATIAALGSFGAIYGLLDDIRNEDTFFESPNDLWQVVGLFHLASTSFDDYLDELGVSSTVSWWRRWFLAYNAPQGIVRDELYQAMNICNNNQVNSQMTALAGLVNAAAFADSANLFAIEGGNDKLIQSAMAQATARRQETCKTKEHTIHKIATTVRTLVSSDFQNTIELFGADGKRLDDGRPYDMVVVATPLQFSGIQFMGKGSVFDESLLYYLPLNEMVQSDNSDANLHEHVHSLGGDYHLPSSALRPYTRVVTTVVSNGKLQPAAFSLDEENLPRSILFTEQGRAATEISSITNLGDGVYKVFSSNELSQDQLHHWFGNDALVEDAKVWGGAKGGATPSFHGGGEASRATNFLLYSNIYYTNAVESAVSAVEIAAIGAKSVAKLVARQLNLIEEPSSRHTTGEEL